jgi:hypothetical protein
VLCTLVVAILALCCFFAFAAPACCFCCQIPQVGMVYDPTLDVQRPADPYANFRYVQDLRQYQPVIPDSPLDLQLQEHQAQLRQRQQLSGYPTTPAFQSQ